MFREAVERLLAALSPQCRQETESAITNQQEISATCRAEIEYIVQSMQQQQQPPPPQDGLGIGLFIYSLLRNDDCLNFAILLCLLSFDI